jgi:DNA-binding FadR family transcriptional regulator
VELLEIRAALGPLIGRLAARRSGPEETDALRAAFDAVRQADGAASRQAADLAYFRALIHSSRNRALGLLYRWVEHAFGGREHELTGAYDDAGPVVADLRAITEAVSARDEAAAAASVEAYLQASALRMVLSYKTTQRSE